MSACPVCKTTMKPLFQTGEFCPNECDLPLDKSPVKQRMKAALDAAYAKAANPKIDLKNIKKAPSSGFTMSPAAWIPFNFGAPATMPSAYTPADDECRDPYCRSKGDIMVSTAGQNYNFYMWQCKLCNKNWTTRSNAPVTQGTFTVN